MATTCPRWEDGQHQFRPGYLVRALTDAQSFAELGTGTRYPDSAVAWRFMALDKDDHRTSAKECACGLVVKMHATSTANYGATGTATLGEVEPDAE